MHLAVQQMHYPGLKEKSCYGAVLKAQGSVSAYVYVCACYVQKDVRTGYDGFKSFGV